VAEYILCKQGAMSTYKLQKLVYYSQAWHLVWADEPLFDARIEAWANGPVVKELWQGHRGRFMADRGAFGDPAALDKAEQGAIDAVLATYGHLSGQQLSYLTHAEDPWRNARGDIPSTQGSNAEITVEALNDYYSAIDVADDATSIDEIRWPDADWTGAHR
jgi:uncharacterized phage-associated protein